MAKIPENIAYGTGQNNQTDRPVSIASYSGALRAMSGRPSPVAGSTPAGFAETGRKQFAAGELSVPIAKAIAPTPTEKYTPLPSSYSGFVNPYRPEEEVPTPSGAVVRSLPGITEGQYIVSPEKPGELFKSARGYIPEEKALILGNRPSNLYQVDHIIPIWAGGADTEANKQVLPINRHDEKTKAQSVPLTLLAHHKINLAQARLMAMQWEKYDISDVPSAEDTQGMLPLQVAEEIQRRWADQEAHPRISWKDFLTAVPESTKGLDKSGLPVPIREAAKGIVSGVTGGWVPYTPGEDAGAVGKAAGFAGNIAGMLGSVFGLAGTISTGAMKLSPYLIKETTKKAAEKGLIKWATPTQIAKDASMRVRVVNFARASNLRKQLVYGRLAKDTAAMITYGQFSREGWDNKAGNFFENLGYAAASGIMPPSIRGAVGAAAAATTIGMMTDAGDARGAVINGFVMGTLHAIGIRGTKVGLAAGETKAKQWLAAEEERVRQLLYDDQAQTAFNTLNTYVGNKVPHIKTTDILPPTEKYTAAEINAWGEESQNVVHTMQNAGTLSTDDAAEAIMNIKAAARSLHNRTLPPEERAQAELADVLTMIKQAETLERGTLMTPKIVQNVADKMDDSWLKTSFRSHDTDTPTGENPVGTIRLSGTGVKELDESGAAYYIAAKAEGRASPTLIAVSTPEYEVHMRGISNAYTPESIAAKEHKYSTNPQNSIAVYGVIFEKDGMKSVVRVGWIPREWKIGDPAPLVDQSNTSFNQTEYAKDMYKKGTPLTGTNKSLNKDTLTEGLNQKGSRVLFLNVINDGFATKEPKKPFIITSVNDENWKASVDFMRRLQGADKNVGIPSLIKQINNTRDAKQKAALIANIKERVKRDADDVLKDAPFTTADPLVLNARETTENMLTTIKEAVNQDSPEAIRNSFAKKLTLHLTPEEAADLFARKGTLSAKDALKFVTNVVNQGRSEPGVREVLSQFVIPYLRSTEFRSWELGKTFLNIKLLGGMEPKVATAPARFGPEEMKFFKKQGFTDEMIADLAARGKEKAVGGFVAEPTTARTTPVSTQAMPTAEPAKTVQPTIKLDQPEAPAPKAGVAPVPPPQAEAVVTPPITPPKAVIPPTRDRIVDRIISGRAKTPIQASQGAPGRTETPKMTQTPPVVKQAISEGGLKPKNRVVEESEQFILQGQEGMDNIAVTGTEAYSLPKYEKQYDAEIARSLRAAKSALLGRGDLDTKTINQIQQNIKTELEHHKDLRLGALAKPETETMGSQFMEKTPKELLPSREDVGPVTASVDSFFNAIDEGLKRDKTSPAYFSAKAQDEAFQSILGANYRQDPTLRALIPSFYENIFFNPLTTKGTQITQPKEVIEAAAAGSFGRTGAYGRAVEESRTAKKSATEAEKEALTKTISEEGAPSMHFEAERPTVYDLVYGESSLMPGVASEKPMTPSMAVRDIKSLFLNKDTGLRAQIQKATGRPISLSGKIFENLEREALRTERTQAGQMAEKREATRAIKPLIEKYKMLEKAVAEEPEKAYLAESLEDTRAAIQKYMNILGITKKAE